MKYCRNHLKIELTTRVNPIEMQTLQIVNKVPILVSKLIFKLIKIETIKFSSGWLKGSRTPKI
jgi:hypothetical protein